MILASRDCCPRSRDRQGAVSVGRLVAKSPLSAANCCNEESEVADRQDHKTNFPTRHEVFLRKDGSSCWIAEASVLMEIKSCPFVGAPGVWSSRPPRAPLAVDLGQCSTFRANYPPERNASSGSPMFLFLVRFVLNGEKNNNRILCLSGENEGRIRV